MEEAMEGDKRREKIIEMLSKSSRPMSGTELAEALNVSRQVIVQDIALLRAVNKSILSTNKGYILFSTKSRSSRRIFCVNHDNSSIEDELNSIVDNNGKVLDVVVEHDIYGQITVDLIINSRKDVKDFLAKLSASSNRSKPLNELTDGVHYHTVEADSEKELDDIEAELRRKGYLIETK
ncbi:MAG: transcription repressor NadR [Clostridia bacterium]|nr:transcription repressor NadR [Clostridia bacterium]